MANSQQELAEQPFSAESYFETQPPPPTLDADVKKVRTFIARHAEAGRKVVLVTSGGTTVPLELNVVRFLDNFSAGTRGSASAEYFLKAGYAVIFMHRQHSLQPFSRHYSHSTNPFLDFLELEEPSNNQCSKSSSTSSSNQDAVIAVRPSNREHLRSVLAAYKAVQKAGTLHSMTFVTVNEYLWLLRAVSRELNVLGRSAMYYLAAAVSDFFLPRARMNEHKIQSGKGSLIIEMDQVPKILKPMVNEWTPESFIVSFKLETDISILISKAQASLIRYGHQVVIGNELHSRRYQVVFVYRASNVPGFPDGDDADIRESWLYINEKEAAAGKEIEEDIVQELVKRHLEWCSSGKV